MGIDERFAREALLLGEDKMERLLGARVIVFGAGGVGGAAIEALARGGVGVIHVVDPDEISVSNINRQILATDATVGKSKAATAVERIRDINPDCTAVAHEIFYTAENTGGIDLGSFDYVVDAIDTVSSKLYLIEECARLGTPIICSMGTGNKLDPTKLTVSDISKTNTCPLAGVIRRECRKRGIKRLKVVWSDEIPRRVVVEDTESRGRHAPASISFVPPVAGMIAAAEVIKAIAGAN